ncbi:MAG TPA: VanZ family protein [Thermoanaerobaculia bacterium]|nr:VanZ family protein [Thermoanaerobaculia bacterium]
MPTEPAVTAMHFLIRKVAHLIEYGILGALLFRALRAGQSGWRLRWALAAVMLTLPVAAGDEVLQSMVIGRTGSPLDVLLDLCGAGAAQLFFRRRNVPATGLLFSRS